MSSILKFSAGHFTFQHIGRVHRENSGCSFRGAPNKTLISDSDLVSPLGEELREEYVGQKSSKLGEKQSLDIGGKTVDMSSCLVPPHPRKQLDYPIQKYHRKH